jgi:hypothetical protein
MRPKTKARKSRAKDAVNIAATSSHAATRKIKGPAHYTGAPLAATRVLTRRMTEFAKTTADCLLVVDAVNGFYYFANTYRAGILPPSFDPEKNRWKLDDKVLKRLESKIKKQGFEELEPPDWPEWTVRAVRRRERKSI